MLKYVYTALACGVVSLSAFTVAGGYSVPEEEQIVSMRRIGHKLLLASGDSLSRVLPVKRVSGTEFELHFEKPFVPGADALVDITAKEQKAGLLPRGYTVTLHNCADGAIPYAYSMPLKNDELAPCLGRPLAKGCYYITLTLKQDRAVAWLSAGVLPLFLFLGWRAYKKKPDIAISTKTSNDYIAIGRAHYYPALQKLILNGENIALTGKEARVLNIFAENINAEVPRERLQKEVWEDEGVIVGRSLDMFISKLRKKLSPDPGIQIVSIHGKGYKMIVE
jgi:hypothetical protein